MITYKVFPNTGQSKTGLACSFSNVDANKIKLTVSVGTFTKGAQTSELLYAKELELNVLQVSDTNLNVLLVKKLSDQSIDVMVFQTSRFTREFPRLDTVGYELIEQLGAGRIIQSVSEAANVDFTEYQWV